MKKASDSIVAAATLAKDKFGLSDTEFAALCGLSLPTTVALLRDGKAPSQARARIAVARFLTHAATAKQRDELRLP